MELLATLVDAARQGDETAFSTIVARFRDNAQSRAYRMVGDYQLAQDAVQEAFTEAFANLEKLREPAAFPGWFRRIVIKRADRLIRGKRLATEPLEEGRHVASTAEDREDGLDGTESRAALESALDSLPESERTAVRQYYFYHLSQKDIARNIDVPVTTVKKRLYASRQRLKARLADLGQSGPVLLPEGRLSLQAHLFTAAWNGFPTKVRRILTGHPDLLSSPNEDGLSILLFAAHAAHHAGRNEVPRLLLQMGAPVSTHAAAAIGLERFLIDRRKESAQATLQRGPWDRTPLHWAASGGHTAVARWLLGQGAAADGRDSWGCTPLHLAVELGHDEVVTLLLEHGADALAKLKNGKSALHLAAQSRNPRILRQLLDRGVAIDVFTAASFGWKDNVSRMLRREPRLVRKRLPFGATALHLAAERGQTQMAEYLVEKGASLDTVCAAELGWTARLMNLLDSAPRSINQKSGSFGFTALHSASSRGRRDLARLLLARGAEVNATDDMYHKTPLGEALYFGNESMARLLYQFGGQA